MFKDSTWQNKILDALYSHFPLFFFLMFLLYPKGWEALAGLYLRQTDVASVTPGGAWLAQGHRQDLIVLLLVGGGVGGRGAEEKS